MISGSWGLSGIRTPADLVPCLLGCSWGWVDEACEMDDAVAERQQLGGYLDRFLRSLAGSWNSGSFSTLRQARLVSRFVLSSFGVAGGGRAVYARSSTRLLVCTASCREVDLNWCRSSAAGASHRFSPFSRTDWLPRQSLVPDRRPSLPTQRDPDLGWAHTRLPSRRTWARDGVGRLAFRKQTGLRWEMT